MSFNLLEGHRLQFLLTIEFMKIIIFPT